MYDPNRPNVNSLIDTFQSDIEQRSGQPVVAFPDLVSDINHNGKYVQIRRHLDDGMYLHTSINKDTADSSDHSYVFVAQPGNRLTREDSHNGVFFGRFWVLPSNEGTEISAQVAVKSRGIERKKDLLGEAALFQHIGRLGLRTFKPAGLVIAPDTVHLMTYFNGDVVTMDTVEWNEATPDEAWLELSKAVDTMYQLHTNKLTHGDLEFRNVAFDTTGDTVIIDPELMTSVQESFDDLSEAGMLLTAEQQVVMDRLVLRMSHEFSAVCKSIKEQIIPVLPKAERPRGSEAHLKLYKKHLFEPYKSLVRDAPEPVRGVLLRVYDEMMTRKKEDARLERL